MTKALRTDGNITYTVLYDDVTQEDYITQSAKVPNWCRGVVVGYILIVFCCRYPWKLSGNVHGT